jgi:hypothetical protein
MGNVESKKHHLILLTGCINPDGMHFTTLQNVDIRKNQYIDAINHYLEQTNCQILFVENSGCDLSSEFINRPPKDLERLEFLTFQGNNYDKRLGKGYGEMSILSYALTNSSFIKDCAFICKITGRYKVLNIKKLLQFYTESDCNIMVKVNQKLNSADSRIFVANDTFFKEYLIKYSGMLNDSNGCYFEHVLSKAVLEAIVNGGTYLPFKHKPRISGQSGSKNHFYPDSFLHWWPRNVLHTIKFKLDENR